MIQNFLENHQGDLIRFVIVLFGGFIGIKIILGLLNKSLFINKVDPTVGTFLQGLLKFVLYAAFIIVILASLGVPITTFVAMLSAIGLAIALALQGNLSNFASAIVILIFKPFKVGDYIEINGMTGTIREIQILFTHIMTPDNRKVIIPNAQLVSNSVINYTSEENRRIDLVFSAGYDDDVERVKSLIMAFINDHEGLLKDPEPIVRLASHGDSALNYDVKVWVEKSGYLNAKYDLMEGVRKVFEENGITIPYPQQDIWMKK